MTISLSATPKADSLNSLLTILSQQQSLQSQTLIPILRLSSFFAQYRALLIFYTSLVVAQQLCEHYRYLRSIRTTSKRLILMHQKSLFINTLNQKQARIILTSLLSPEPLQCQLKERERALYFFKTVATTSKLLSLKSSLIIPGTLELSKWTERQYLKF